VHQAFLHKQFLDLAHLQTKIGVYTIPLARTFKDIQIGIAVYLRIHLIVEASRLNPQSIVYPTYINDQAHAKANLLVQMVPLSSNGRLWYFVQATLGCTLLFAFTIKQQFVDDEPEKTRIHDPGAAI
jgi:hypothetical protein